MPNMSDTLRHPTLIKPEEDGAAHAARDRRARQGSAGVLNAACVLSFGVLVGLAWSEWWPAGELATQAQSRLACEQLVAAGDPP